MPALTRKAKHRYFESEEEGNGSDNKGEGGILAQCAARRLAAWIAHKEAQQQAARAEPAHKEPVRQEPARQESGCQDLAYQEPRHPLAAHEEPPQQQAAHQKPQQQQVCRSVFLLVSL